jgi:uncharacterized repeat protein (TIGR03803 family)
MQTNRGTKAKWSVACPRVADASPVPQSAPPRPCRIPFLSECLVFTILAAVLIPSKVHSSYVFDYIASYPNDSFIYYSYATLVRGEDDCLYGTTESGGSTGYGTVFKTTLDGQWTTLVSFNSTNGDSPVGSLVLGTDGNFYGTTSMEDTGHGTVFQVSSNGTFHTLYRFEGTNGSFPMAGLIQGTDGDFYGTTFNGGPHTNLIETWAHPGFGTVFKISTNGTLTSLVTFDGTNGAGPASSLIQISNGDFYGTTAYGGEHNLGTVFKMTANGVITTLLSFSGTNGATPLGPLVEGSDGYLYGTTYYGGFIPGSWNERGHGSVFRLTPAGVFTNLAFFNGANGSQPRSPLLQINENTFYGTAYRGNGTRHDYGTVYQIATNGEISVLIKFNDNSGTGLPAGGLVKGSDGHYYGTTQIVGVYRMQPAIPPVFQTCAREDNQISFTWSGMTNQLYRIQFSTDLSAGTWYNLALIFPGEPFTFTDTILPGPPRYYRIALVPRYDY